MSGEVQLSGNEMLNKKVLSSLWKVLCDNGFWDWVVPEDYVIKQALTILQASQLITRERSIVWHNFDIDEGDTIEDSEEY